MSYSFSRLPITNEVSIKALLDSVPRVRFTNDCSNMHEGECLIAVSVHSLKMKLWKVVNYDFRQEVVDGYIFYRVSTDLLTTLSKMEQMVPTFRRTILTFPKIINPIKKEKTALSF